MNMWLPTASAGLANSKHHHNSELFLAL